MIRRRRGATPPAELLDYHDQGRDHITGPKKNDGLHTHSWQKNVETAGAPTNSTGVEPMSTTIQSTNVHPPTGFSKIAPSEPDSAWSRDDLAVGCDYDVSWTQEDGLKIHAYGQEVGIEDIAATITDLIHFWSRCRAVQDELAARH